MFFHITINGIICVGTGTVLSFPYPAKVFPGSFPFITFNCFLTKSMSSYLSFIISPILSPQNKANIEAIIICGSFIVSNNLYTCSLLNTLGICLYLFILAPLLLFFLILPLSANSLMLVYFFVYLDEFSLRF